MLGQRIANLRRQMGLSQSELAQRLGISPSTMGMYEQGLREPPADILIALSRELKVTTDFLLTGQISSQLEEADYSRMIMSLVDTADRRLDKRENRPFSRQELAFLFAALLRE